MLVLLCVQAYPTLQRCGRLPIFRGIFRGVSALVCVVLVVQLFTFRIYIGVLKRTLSAAGKDRSGTAGASSKTELGGNSSDTTDTKNSSTSRELV